MISDSEDDTYSRDSKMGLRGCGNFLKYSMFLFNSVILIAGCGILGLGIYLKTSKEEVSKIAGLLGRHMYSLLSIVIMACGAIIVLLSFLGCCGAIKEVRCMLVAFFVLLMVMFVGLLVGGIVVYAIRHKLSDITRDVLYSALNNTYGVSEYEQTTHAVDTLQKIFQCCGVEGSINGTNSWAFYKYHSAWFRNQSSLDPGDKKYIPDSCCKSKNPQETAMCNGRLDKTKMPYLGPPVPLTEENDLVYTQGCLTALIAVIEDNVKIIIGVAIGTALIMILGMVFALCLCRRIQEEYYYE